jgi:hypothetical protein
MVKASSRIWSHYFCCSAGSKRERRVSRVLLYWCSSSLNSLLTSFCSKWFEQIYYTFFSLKYVFSISS